MKSVGGDHRESELSGFMLDTSASVPVVYLLPLSYSKNDCHL